MAKKGTPMAVKQSAAAGSKAMSVKGSGKAKGMSVKGASYAPKK